MRVELEACGTAIGNVTDHQMAQRNFTYSTLGLLLQVLGKEELKDRGKLGQVTSRSKEGKCSGSGRGPDDTEVSYNTG